MVKATRLLLASAVVMMLALPGGSSITAPEAEPLPALQAEILAILHDETQGSMVLHEDQVKSFRERVLEVIQNPTEPSNMEPPTPPIIAFPENPIPCYVKDIAERQTGIPLIDDEGSSGCGSGGPTCEGMELASVSAHPIVNHLVDAGRVKLSIKVSAAFTGQGWSDGKHGALDKQDFFSPPPFIFPDHVSDKLRHVSDPPFVSNGFYYLQYSNRGADCPLEWK